MKGNTFITNLLKHLYNNDALALIGDATGLLGAGTVGSFYVAFHTADPGAGGSQNTSECAYTSYARTAIPRSTAGFTVASQQVSNTALVSAPACTGGSEVATHFSYGTAASGAGMILHSGPLASGAKIFTAKATDILTVPGNAFIVDDRVVSYPVVNVSLPAGLTGGTVYWVKTVSGDDITLSTTQGGATLDITGVGGGKIALSRQLAISNGVTPQIATAAGVVTEN